MKGTRSSFVIACFLIICLHATQGRHAKPQQHIKSLNLAQVHGQMMDGWDDSYVSEAIIDKDNTKAKQREQKEDIDMNSAENIEKNFAQTVLNQKVEQIKDEVLMFSKSLDKEHLKNAIEMKQTLQEQNNNIEDIQISTKDLYENAFQFPNVAQYEHVQSQLSELQSAQDNLNQNQENPILQNKFVRIATKVRDNFNKAYKDQWTDPSNSV